MHKSIWKSRTFWYNLVVFVGAIVTAGLAFAGQLEEAGVVGVGVVSVLAAVDKVINIILRILTSEPISVRKP